MVKKGGVVVAILKMESAKLKCLGGGEIINSQNLIKC